MGSPIIKLSLEYRDADNYKTHFIHEVNADDHPGIRFHKDDEIKMGQYGTLDENEFFDSKIHPFPYNPKYDHNILTVNEVIV